jgi:uncharacterized protein
MQSRFHYSFYVHDLDEARRFYGEVLGCVLGRESNTWVDFDFFGHELSLHLGEPMTPAFSGQVDHIKVPMPHFGVVIHSGEWEQLRNRLEAAQVSFILPPCRRFAGKPTEHRTLFIADPSGNAIEIKGFDSLDALFLS